MRVTTYLRSHQKWYTTGIRHSSVKAQVSYRAISRRYYRKETDVKAINKILVANRGAVAIRIFRACAELGIKSVAVHSNEDRVLSHKLKADESYLIGERQHPIKAYLDINEIVKVCKNAGVDAVHPGYGFLAGRTDFAEALIKAGVQYIGPTVSTLNRLRDKSHARRIANELLIPIVPGTDVSIRYLDEAVAFLKRVGVPMVVKATFGSEGKCIQLVEDPRQLNDTLDAVVKDARLQFGDGRIYLEQYLPNTRLVEVQIAGDMMGNIFHLFDRDCSIQAKYSKFCSMAPAPNLSQKTRDELVKATLLLAKYVEYEDIGTFEFLVDSSGKFYFLEANPYLTPEHSTTEEITGIDLVQTQIKIAEGRPLSDYFSRNKIVSHGCAIQCRLTAEDPQENFYPSTGKMEVFRIGAGPGIRMDGAHGIAGTNVEQHYDPLLLILTAWGETLKAAARRMARTLKEYRISGIKTNIRFLINIVENRNFRRGHINMAFLTENPTLFIYKLSTDRSYALGAYIGNILVNGPSTPFYTDHKPQHIVPVVPDVSVDSPPDGLRTVLKTKGVPTFIKAVKDQKNILLVDTTFRDAHESLLLGRVRTYDLLRIAPFIAHNFSNLFSLDMWGGTTFGIAMKYLHECPWRRLIQLRQLIPNIPFEMQIITGFIVGFSVQPDNVVYHFCLKAVEAGIDIISISDALNYLPAMKVAMNAAQKAGGVVEACIAYAGDVGDSNKTRYPLQYYLDIVEKLVSYGAHIVCIRDNSSLLKPYSAKTLMTSLKQNFPDIIFRVHTHDTSGNGVATLLSSALAGAAILDVAVDTMSGITSQPSMGAVVAALQGSKFDTSIDLNSVSKYSEYWEQTRTLYAPFECTSTMKSGNSDVYSNEIPGRQYIILQFQAYHYGAGNHFEDVKRAYAEANMLVGDIPKSFPTYQTVGELAHFMLQNKLSVQDITDKAEDLAFPNSVVNFFLGVMGQPHYGFPEPLRTKIIKGMQPVEGRLGSYLPPLDLKQLEEELKGSYDNINEYDVLSAAMYPNTAREFFEFRTKYGPVEKLSTRLFLIGPRIGEEFFVVIDEGKTVEIKVLAVSHHHNSQGERPVFYALSGVVKVAYIPDKTAGQRVVINPQADKGNKLHVGAPMRGVVIKINVRPGNVVEKHYPLVVLYAMKMETTIFCPFPTVIKDVFVSVGSTVDIGDLVLTLE